MAENGNIEKISSNQRKAIAALLGSRSVPEAAEVAGLGERTIYRYMEEPAFRLALAEAEGEAIDTATRRLVGLQDLAIDTLEAVLKSPGTSDTVRVRAAGQVIEYLLKLRELRNIEQRLTALEERALAAQRA